MEEFKKSEILSSEYRRKKIITWFIRTTIAVVLAIIFWEYTWVQWALYIYIPLNIIVLIMILLVPYFLRKKQEKLEKNLDEL